LQGRSGYLYGNAANNKSLVTTFHGLSQIETAAENKTFGSFIYTKVTGYFEKLSAKHSTQIISVSNALKSDLIKYKISTGNDVDVIHNGIEAVGKQIIKSNNKTKNRVLFVGRLHPIKGIEVLKQTLEFLHKDIQLDIIGDGPMELQLKQWVQDNNLEDRVKLLGSKTRNEVYQYMQDSLLLFLPSTYETQGIVLLEANANGIPVVASDLKAIRETVQEGSTGLLCAANNPRQFAWSINYLYEHPEISRRMGQEGCARVKAKFTWERIANETVQVYEKVLAA
jgi:glycosyltransferase involved in cell wall biosynthesis